jgi:hypothetical protein
MTTLRKPDPIIAAWLEEGPTLLPEATRRAIAVATRTTTQHRRAISVPWRLPTMNLFARTALAAVALVAVVGGTLYVTAPRTGVGGPSPEPSVTADGSSKPSATPTPAPIDPATWVAYTSERFGYTLEHPADWTIKPSQLDWEPGAIHSELSQWPDELNDPEGGYAAGGYTIYAGRQGLETSQTPEAWAAQYISNKVLDAGGICGDISADQYEPIEIDGEIGQRIEMVCASSAFYTAVFAVHDGSAYLVALATPSNSRDARAIELLDAVLASFRFAAS